MRVLNPYLDLNRFFTRLRRARERVLLVDYDGTLAPFHSQPQNAVPYPCVAKLLNDIGEKARSRVVMVSGRSFADMEVPLAHIRSSDVWASHGWQRGRRGEPRIDYAPEPAERRGLDALAARDMRAELQRAWPKYEKQGLEMLEFDGGLELRSRTRTKGDAVKAVLAESAPGAMCAYLGDDRTDEDAFKAIRPRGIGVLVRPALRRTLADLWLEPPRELVEFLGRWRACGQAA